MKKGEVVREAGGDACATHGSAVEWPELGAAGKKAALGPMSREAFDREVAAYRMCQEVFEELRGTPRPKGMMLLFDGSSRGLRIEGLGAEVFLEEFRRCLTARYCSAGALLGVETLAVNGNGAPSTVLGERRVG